MDKQMLSILEKIRKLDIKNNVHEIQKFDLTDHVSLVVSTDWDAKERTPFAPHFIIGFDTQAQEEMSIFDMKFAFFKLFEEIFLDKADELGIIITDFDYRVRWDINNPMMFHCRPITWQMDD